MRYNAHLLFLIFLLTAGKVFSQDSGYSALVSEYIAQYAPLAVEEQRRTGIPAAVKLAQAIHETGAGKSILATQANNHFGIKCKRNWTGETFAYTDDAPDECFRKYSTPEDSYRDHSDYLKNNTRYNMLFRLSLTDYAAWAYGLKKCGYATNPRYAQLLIKIIEDYKLQQYTYAAMSEEQNPIRKAETPAPVIAGEVVPELDALEETDAPVETPEVNSNEKPPYGQLVRVHGLRAFYAEKGTHLLKMAAKHKILYSKLLDINDLPDAPLEADMFIYLEKKHNKGKTSLHVVKPGETLLQAAQYEGMQLKTLRQLNRLSVGEEPAPGALLYLQEVAPGKPETIKVAKNVADRPNFAGSNPNAVPPGGTRTRPGYLSKKEIEQQGKTPTAELPQTNPATANSTSKDIGLPAKPMSVNIPKPVPVTSPTVTSAAPPPAPITPTPKPQENTSVPSKVEPEVVKTQEPPKEEVPEEKPEEPVLVKETLPVPKTVSAPETKEITVTKENITPKTVPVPVQEPIAPPPIPEPKDEYDRLKMKLDKVVYATRQISQTQEAEQPAVETPAPEPSAETTNKSSESSSSNPAFYTVKKGDTAFSIAKKHNITMKQLREWNNLNFEELKVGQKLRVK